MLKIDSSFAGLAYSFRDLLTTFFKKDVDCVERASTDLADLKRATVEEFPEPVKHAVKRGGGGLRGVEVLEP